ATRDRYSQPCCVVICKRHARARGHPARGSLPSIQRFLDSRFRGNDGDSNSVGRKLGHCSYEWQKQKMRWKWIQKAHQSWLLGSGVGSSKADRSSVPSAFLFRISTFRSASSSFAWQNRESVTPSSYTSSSDARGKSPLSSFLTISSRRCNAVSKS